MGKKGSYVGIFKDYKGSFMGVFAHQIGFYNR